MLLILHVINYVTFCLTKGIQGVTCFSYFVFLSSTNHQNYSLMKINSLVMYISRILSLLYINALTNRRLL